MLRTAILCLALCVVVLGAVFAVDRRGDGDVRASPVLDLSWGDYDCDNVINGDDSVSLLIDLAHLNRNRAGDCFQPGELLNFYRPPNPETPDGQQLPPFQGEYYWGDYGCNGQTDVVDVLTWLLLDSGVINGDGNCLLLTTSGQFTTSTPTPPPCPLTPPATPFPCETSAVTPTPIATPTPILSPTVVPDTTGPSITNATDDVDPICDSEGRVPTDVVNITATITDPSGISDVVLHLRYVGGTANGDWFTTTASVDSQTGDWEKFVNYPGTAQEDADIWWYWEATDGVGNTSINPPAAPADYNTTHVRYCD